MIAMKVLGKSNKRNFNYVQVWLGLINSPNWKIDHFPIPTHEIQSIVEQLHIALKIINTKYVITASSFQQL